MKKILLALLLVLMAAPMTMAQEEASSSELETFERCNNWARRYCADPAHAAAVDAKLLELKQKGVPITLQRIKLLASRTNPNPPTPE